MGEATVEGDRTLQVRNALAYKVPGDERPAQHGPGFGIARITMHDLQQGSLRLFEPLEQHEAVAEFLERPRLAQVEAGF